MQIPSCEPLSAAFSATGRRGDPHALKQRPIPAKRIYPIDLQRNTAAGRVPCLKPSIPSKAWSAGAYGVVVRSALPCRLGRAIPGIRYYRTRIESIRVSECASGASGPFHPADPHRRKGRLATQPTVFAFHGIQPHVLRQVDENRKLAMDVRPVAKDSRVRMGQVGSPAARHDPVSLVEAAERPGSRRAARSTGVAMRALAILVCH